MNRRALIVVAAVVLLVLGVVISGPRTLWDAFTLHTIERHYPDGQPRLRYRVVRWAPDEIDTYGPRDFAVYTRVAEAWHPNGQRASTLRLRPRVHGQQWAEDGALVANYVQEQGQLTGVLCHGNMVNGVMQQIDKQLVYEKGRVVDERVPPHLLSDLQVRTAVDAALE